MATIKTKVVKFTLVAEENRKLVNDAVKAAVLAMADGNRRYVEIADVRFGVFEKETDMVFSSSDGKAIRVLAVRKSNSEAHADQADQFWARLLPAKAGEGYLGVFDKNGNKVGECKPNVKPVVEAPAKAAVANSNLAKAVAYVNSHSNLTAAEKAAIISKAKAEPASEPAPELKTKADPKVNKVKLTPKQAKELAEADKNDPMAAMVMRLHYNLPV